MFGKGDFELLDKNYKEGMYVRWSGRELRTISKIDMMWCNGEYGIVKFHSEFVKDHLWIEYGIRSERDIDGWYVVIDRDK